LQLAINIGMTAHPVQRTNPTIGNLVYWYNGKFGYNPIPSTNLRMLRSQIPTPTLRQRDRRSVAPLPVAPLPVAPLPVAPLPVAPLPDAPLPDAPALPA